MQVRVKTPHTDIYIQGKIPGHLLEALKSEYGATLKMYEGDEEYVDITTTDWYNSLKLTPSDTMRIYRENAGLTQAQLGDRIGGLSRQAVSGMERGKRPIRLNIAEKLAGIFKAPVHRFFDH